MVSSQIHTSEILLNHKIAVSSTFPHSSFSGYDEYSNILTEHMHCVRRGCENYAADKQKQYTGIRENEHRTKFWTRFLIFVLFIVWFTFYPFKAFCQNMLTSSTLKMSRLPYYVAARRSKLVYNWCVDHAWGWWRAEVVKMNLIRVGSVIALC